MTGSDEAWWAQAGEAGPPQPFAGHELRSSYVPLSDGTPVAVDVYLPGGLPAGERVLALFCATPYFRGLEFRSRVAERLMARAFTGGGGNWWPALARYGYAVVVMEQRGSGASFGQRSLDPAAEVKDMTDVVDWVVGQAWSDGRLASIGVSAMGLTAQLLLTARHPAVVASIPMFAAFDLYAGTHPGGLMFNRSITNIGDAMRAMDSNRFAELAPSRAVRLLMKALVRGVRPVEGDHDRALLAEAVRAHAANEYIDVAILSVEYRDDAIVGTSSEMTIDARSPATYADDMTAAGMAVSGYAGWWDSASALEMLQLHASVPTPGSRLVIGPWGHAGTKQVGPERGKKPTRSRFDYPADVARFLNRLLSGQAVAEGGVHYFTFGEDRWKHAVSWPPPADLVRLYFGDEGQLDAAAPASGGSDKFEVDPSVGTGPVSRWALEKHPVRGVRYPDRRTTDARLLTYTSLPLPAATEVTGHPLVRLFVSSAAPDGAFIAYLEDVAPDGSVSYVTEGELRAIHRAVGTEPPGYRLMAQRVRRAFTRADARDLRPDEVTELVFDLQPISYRLSAGSSIRVAVATGDCDNFSVVGATSPRIDIHHGPGQQSLMELPVVRPSAVSGT